MIGELESAWNYIKQCKEIYPELDLMDNVTRRIYDHCWEIIRYHEEKEKRVQISNNENIIKPKKVKIKRIGKLKFYEDQVLECLHQGFGEEKQLFDEACARKNKWARINYLKAFYRALDRFQRGE